MEQGALLLIGFLCVAVAIALRAPILRRFSLHRQRELALLRRRARKLTGILNSTRDGIVLSSLDGRVLFANDPFCEMFQRDRSEIIGVKPQTYCFPPEAKPTDAEIEGFRYDPADPIHNEHEIVPNVRKDGTQFWCQISTSFHADERGETVVVLVARDITPQIRAQEALEEARQELHAAATRDPLTGAANRASLQAFVDRLLADGAEGDSAGFGVIKADIDRFKLTNDAFGHAAGDAVLSHVADTLKSAAGGAALVARLGGDEFVVILPGITTETELVRAAQDLHRQTCVEVHWQQRVIPCWVSIGATLSEPADADLEPILRRADHALYRSKRRGRQRVAIYDAALRKGHQRSDRLAESLRRDIANNRLTYHYQPIIRTSDGHISGFESLLRWSHPTEGPVPPKVVLDLATEFGLLAELDNAAMLNGLDLAAQLVKSNSGEVRVGFNASNALLAQHDLADRLLEETQGRNLKPENVVIEILETVVLDDTFDHNPAAETARKLGEAGFGIMLDDFGSGHAGLTHLAQLPLTGIKLDKTLVGRTRFDDHSRKIVAAVADLCRDLGISTVAEGVDDRDTALWLSDVGYQRFQGHWLAPAMPASEVQGFLNAHDPAAYRLAPPIGKPVNTDAPVRLHGTR